MKKIIWKFPLELSSINRIKMPKDSEILTVQIQYNSPCIWAIVNPDNEMEVRIFETFGTGHDILCDMGLERKYINTFQIQEGNGIYHVFERIN